MIVEKKTRKVCKCPKCGSTHIDQFRMMTGPIWCADCGHRVEHKERDNSFYVEEVFND